MIDDDDDDAFMALTDRMEHMIKATRHLIYAATNERYEAIAVAAVLLAEFCARGIPTERRAGHLDGALKLIDQIWKIADAKPSGTGGLDEPSHH